MEVKAEIKKQEQRILDNFLFYFASFGAASAASLLLVLLARFVSTALGVHLSVVSFTWIFLFLMPGILAVVSFLISRSLGLQRVQRIDYGIILGYVAYSISSLVIIFFIDESGSVWWFFPVLAFIVTGVFLSGFILEGVFFRSDKVHAAAEPDSQELSKGFVLVNKEENKFPEKRTDKKPMLLIRASDDDKAKEVLENKDK